MSRHFSTNLRSYWIWERKFKVYNSLSLFTFNPFWIIGLWAMICIILVSKLRSLSSLRFRLFLIAYLTLFYICVGISSLLLILDELFRFLSSSFRSILTWFTLDTPFPSSYSSLIFTIPLLRLILGYISMGFVSVY
jgi:hypothetical protein